jgi:hypothetical protein
MTNFSSMVSILWMTSKNIQTSTYRTTNVWLRHLLHYQYLPLPIKTPTLQKPEVAGSSFFSFSLIQLNYHMYIISLLYSDIIVNIHISLSLHLYQLSNTNKFHFYKKKHFLPVIKPKPEANKAARPTLNGWSHKTVFRPSTGEFKPSWPMNQKIDRSVNWAWILPVDGL